MTQQSIAFDRAADFYDETRGLPPSVVPQMAAAVVRAGQLDEHAAVLEIGVGTGRITLPTARESKAWFVGVDLAVPMMQKLREKRTRERVEIVEGDVTRLPVASGAFDAVMAAHIFHLVSDWEAALAEVRRVLRPGGVLLFCWRTYERNPLRAAFDTARRDNDGDRYKRFRGTGFLERSGWRPAGRAGQVPYQTMETPAERIAQLEGRIWSSLWDLPDEEIAARVAAVRAAVAEQGIQEDEPVVVKMTFNVAPFRPA